MFLQSTESCHFAMQQRSSSGPRINKRVTPPFKLVNSDTWGPCPVESYIEFKYFVTFVDDFSLVTLIYSMKNWSEVFSHIRVFCAEVKTQFNLSVHIVRSNNAKE